MGPPCIKIIFIIPRKKTTDFTLKEYSDRYAISYYNETDVNSDEFYNLVTPLNCDIFVSMSFNQIFKPRILNVPRLGTINCHAGMLPFYRGRNILNWALINGEKEFGITVHYVDEGIDTGDIILQRAFPITDDDDYRSLLEKAYSECAIILFDALKLIQDSKVFRIKQNIIHPTGFYCGQRGIGDEIINWNSNSRTLFNFIRALSFPGPSATTFINDNVVKINKAKVITSAPVYINFPGQLLKKTKDGFWVKTKDTFIEISEIQSIYKLKVGDKLGQ